MSYSEKDIYDFEIEHNIQILQRLGEGSFGTVFEAYDKSQQKMVAIKIIPKTLMRSTHIEQSIMSSLRHPNIVEFICMIETKHNFHLIMELIQHGSLRQLIYERKKLHQSFSDVEVSTVMNSIFMAVDYMHQKQILHRDLKPENILIKNKENLSTIKVVDFGLSFQFSQEGGGHYQKLLQQKCGTFIFMAPEQLLKTQYSKPVDVWSCGIIMYMLFSMGRHPTAKPNETKEHYIENHNRDWIVLDNMSDLAADFMRRITSLNPLERYSAGQALMHPWLTRRLTDDIPLNYSERIMMFKQELSFARKLKFVYYLMYLHRNLESQTKEQASVRFSFSSDVSPLQSAEPLSLRRNTLQMDQMDSNSFKIDRNSLKIVKGTQSNSKYPNKQQTLPSSQSTSPNISISPKKYYTRNFRLMVQEIPNELDESIQIRSKQPSIDKFVKMYPAIVTESFRYHHNTSNSVSLSCALDQITRRSNNQIPRRGFSPYRNNNLSKKEKINFPPIFKAKKMY